MSRSRTVLGVALIIGLLAALTGYAGLHAMARQVVASTSKQFVPVVVSATDLTFGTKLDKAQLRVARYPKESVPAGCFSDVDSVAGQTTKIFLAAREPVTATKLSSRGGGLSMLVRSGLRATSLEVNQVSGVRGFVLPGDRVDGLGTVDGRGSKEDALTRTIIQNAEVLASGQRTAQQDNKPITVQAVTILVDPVGAEKLALSLHEGKLHLVLRNPQDSDTLRVGALDTGEMLGSPPTRVAAAPVRSQRSRQAPPSEYVPPPQVADAAVGSARTVVVNGKSAGVTSLVVWEEGGRHTLYRVTSFDANGSKQVLLQCKVAELNEQRLAEFGLDWIASGTSDRLEGTLSGGLFVTKVEQPGNPLVIGPTTDAFTNYRRADGTLTLLSPFRAMQQRGAARTLASPTLV